MHYIDNISPNPWSIIDFRKYCLYLEMRKERDKFLKSIREMTYQDWLIEKKLIEAGGLGRTVYVLPARGGGTSLRTLKKINDYIEEGRNVKVVTLKKYDWPSLSSKDIEALQASIREFELYSQLVRLQRDSYYEMFKDFYPKEPYTLDPCYSVDPYGNYRLREVSLVRREDKYEDMD